MLGGGGIAGDANLNQLAVFVDQRDVGGALLIVGIHQLVEHLGAGLTDLREKAHVPGLGRQPLDEGVFTLAVFLRQRPDQYMAAVLERFDPVLSGDCGVGRCGPIVVVFDGEHGVILHSV